MDICQVTPNDIERFWTRVDRSDLGRCWEWKFCRDKDGYGLFSLWLPLPRRQVRVRAHRFSMAIAMWEVPHLHVLHACDNPPCVNPNHLTPGSADANRADCVLKGRQGGGRPPTIPDEVVRQVRLDGRPQSVVAREFGLSRSYVGMLQAGRRRSGAV